MLYTAESRSHVHVAPKRNQQKRNTHRRKDWNKRWLGIFWIKVWPVAIRALPQSVTSLSACLWFLDSSLKIVKILDTQHLIQARTGFGLEFFVFVFFSFIRKNHQTNKWNLNNLRVTEYFDFSSNKVATADKWVLAPTKTSETISPFCLPTRNLS